MVMRMRTSRQHSRGSQRMREWRGDRKQIDVLPVLGLVAPAYSRFEGGRRKPTAPIAARIELVTGGFVPATSWYEPVAADAPTTKAKAA